MTPEDKKKFKELLSDFFSSTLYDQEGWEMKFLNEIKDFMIERGLIVTQVTEEHELESK